MYIILTNIIILIYNCAQTIECIVWSLLRINNTVKLYWIFYTAFFFLIIVCFQSLEIQWKKDDEGLDEQWFSSLRGGFKVTHKYGFLYSLVTGT